MDKEFLNMVPGSHSVLIVGDGDFSFSVAFTKRYSNLNVTSTTLESEAIMISKYPDLLRNLEYLKHKGVEVKTSVDATSLQDIFNGTPFSYIIFNFPHVGGKSNIKKNRQLLDSFFKSAVGHLTDMGVILVTLCQGQGGTSADEPQREWCNSWQVTSKAANSGLILKSVNKFEAAEIFQDYLSTGFRSQNKMFRTQGSLVHKFMKSDFPPQPNTFSDPVCWPSEGCLAEQLVSILCQCWSARHNTNVSQQSTNDSLSSRYCSNNVTLVSDSYELEDIYFGESFKLSISDSCISLESLSSTSQLLVVGKAASSGDLSVAVALILQCLFEEKDTRYFARKDLNLGNLVMVGENKVDIVKGTQLSIYPPSYFFDVSFWVKENFYTEMFTSYVYKCSNHLVRDVTLIDTYTHPQTHSVSHCYRLTYQSLDRALPYSYAYQYYQWMRTHLPTVLRVILR